MAMLSFNHVCRRKFTTSAEIELGQLKFSQLPLALLALAMYI
jgi:hypothetical protein